MAIDGQDAAAAGEALEAVLPTKIDEGSQPFGLVGDEPVTRDAAALAGPIIREPHGALPAMCRRLILVPPSSTVGST
jgi:hypothetical protein